MGIAARDERRWRWAGALTVPAGADVRASAKFRRVAAAQRRGAWRALGPASCSPRASGSVPRSGRARSSMKLQKACPGAEPSSHSLRSLHARDARGESALRERCMRATGAHLASKRRAHPPCACAIANASDHAACETPEAGGHLLAGASASERGARRAAPSVGDRAGRSKRHLRLRNARRPKRPRRAR